MNNFQQFTTVKLGLKWSIVCPYGMGQARLFEGGSIDYKTVQKD